MQRKHMLQYLVNAAYYSLVPSLEEGSFSVSSCSTVLSADLSTMLDLSATSSPGSSRFYQSPRAQRFFILTKRGRERLVRLMADENGGEIATGSETKVSKRKLKRLQVEAASKLRCNLCVNKRFTSLKMYDDHMASKNHRKKELRKDTSGVWVCQACDLTLNSQTEWKKHLCGRRHHEKLAEWSLELFPTSSPIRQREIDLLDDSKYQEFEEDNEDGMVE